MFREKSGQVSEFPQSSQDCFKQRWAKTNKAWILFSHQIWNPLHIIFEACGCVSKLDTLLTSMEIGKIWIPLVSSYLWAPVDTHKSSNHSTAWLRLFGRKALIPSWWCCWCHWNGRDGGCWRRWRHLNLDQLKDLLRIFWSLRIKVLWINCTNAILYLQILKCHQIIPKNHPKQKSPKSPWDFCSANSPRFWPSAAPRHVVPRRTSLVPWTAVPRSLFPRPAAVLRAAKAPKRPGVFVGPKTDPVSLGGRGTRKKGHCLIMLNSS